VIKIVKKLIKNPFKKVKGSKYLEMRTDLKFRGYKIKSKIYRTKRGMERALKKSKSGTVATPVYVKK